MKLKPQKGHSTEGAKRQAEQQMAVFDALPQSARERIASFGGGIPMKVIYDWVRARYAITEQEMLDFLDELEALYPDAVNAARAKEGLPPITVEVHHERDGQGCVRREPIRRGSHRSVGHVRPRRKS